MRIHREWHSNPGRGPGQGRRVPGQGQGRRGPGQGQHRGQACRAREHMAWPLPHISHQLQVEISKKSYHNNAH